MKRFVAGLALGIALTALAGIAYASIPDGGGVVHTCYGPGNTWRPIDFPKEQCKSNETALNLNQTGPQGPQGIPGAQGAPGPKGDKGDAGSFSGTFASPNGLFSISVTDTGIQLSGPGGNIGITGTAINVNGASSVNVQSSGNVSVTGSGTARLGGGTTVLCSSGSGLPVARAGDQVNTPALPIGVINAGATAVSAC